MFSDPVTSIIDTQQTETFAAAALSLYVTKVYVLTSTDFLTISLSHCTLCMAVPPFPPHLPLFQFNVYLPHCVIKLSVPLMSSG